MNPFRSITLPTRNPTPDDRRQSDAGFLQFALWSWFFFGFHRIGLALVDIVVLWVLILGVIVLFWRVRPLAGGLLLPYIVWVSYATALNAAIWLRNSG
ncbi:MAG: tryptophan-rich sensory protein [Gemmatimonadota bacterium]|nr:MAG: tryptophan-rich sensory protein [Gemmatimonadota bacterium]